MYKKAWCTSKVVVLLKKPIVFLTFLLPSSPLDVKVPIRHSAARTLISQFKISQTETTETTHLFFPATSLKWHSSKLQNCLLCLSSLRRSKMSDIYIFNHDFGIVFFLWICLIYLTILYIYLLHLFIYFYPFIHYFPPSVVRFQILQTPLPSEEGAVNPGGGGYSLIRA